MKREYSEDALVEQPAIKLFAELGWETANCWGERFGDGGDVLPGGLYLGRETPTEVVLWPPIDHLLLDTPKRRRNQADVE